jgi:hypothetical protein
MLGVCESDMYTRPEHIFTILFLKPIVQEISNPIVTLSSNVVMGSSA